MRAIYPEEKRLLVEDALHRFFPSEDNYPQVIYKAMRHSLFSGGKRFRPVLTLLSAETFECAPEGVLPTACAIEYIHTYSLIHDDLPAIDNDDLRRGQPTCHVLFGEDIAILAGDALFAEAFYLVSAKQQTDDPLKIIRVIGELASASGARGMVGGQVMDVLSSGRRVDFATLNFIHTHKTGELIKAAARVGAILAGASEEELAIITEYAHHLGLAFQITDDILDVVGETVLLGKKIGSDREQLKPTFPAAFGLERSRELAREETDKAKEALTRLRDKDTRALANLAEFVRERES
ncbi:MAG: polyprenyl synthetase family protein [Actinomycetota bacterium]|nr:polyprenyl synthetase family protein [Actinomycetota bacterium]MDI6821378.1 polyprenyl synthetase family protein [Actinomycetota bacterium]